MDCKDACRLMHKYLDGDADGYEKQGLSEHMKHCAACEDHFTQLQKTESFLKGSGDWTAPDDFVENVMAQLPKEKKGSPWQKWMKRHPFIVAASLFLFLMSGSLLSIWNEGNPQFQLTASQPDQLQIDREEMVVVVPEGIVVEGDIMVRHGDIDVKGEVNGNVVAIDGEVLLASTDAVSGQAEEIDQVLEWIWYHVKQAVTGWVD